jgi:diguanylate cyclase (GGDEF)-like protein
MTLISKELSISHMTPIGYIFPKNHCIQCFDDHLLLQEVFDYFTTHSSDVVIITQETNPIGIITLKDMVHSMKDCESLTRPAKELMSTPIKTFGYTLSIAEVLDTMSQADYDKIVVVNEKNSVIGVMDRRHLLSLCYAQLTPLIKHEHNIIHSMLGLVSESERGLLKLATTDALTGIVNRRLFEEIFQAHQSLGKRYDVSLFLLMFDIDNFKSINDTFGHVVGDSVLKELTELVSQTIRKSDIFIRWGGEEFTILLQYPDSLKVMKIAEHIRQAIDKHSFKTIVHITCSFGMTAIYPFESLEEVIERADKALYRAKVDGKNTIRMEIS